MATDHQADCRADFEERGWIVLRGVVPRDALAEMEAAFDAAMGDLPRPAPLPDGRSVWQLPGGARPHEALLTHLRGELGGIVAELLGASRLQLLQDTLIVKPGLEGAAVPLHQDYTYTGFLERPDSAGVRLSLSGERVEDGCLWVVDGSHRWGVQGDYAPFTDALQRVALEQLAGERRSRLEAERRPVELEPGDVSLHHCLLFHGSFENVGPRTRKTIVTHVFDGACRLKRDRLSEAVQGYFETDASGRLTGECFPILYDGTEAA